MNEDDFVIPDWRGKLQQLAEEKQRLEDERDEIAREMLNPVPGLSFQGGTTFYEEVLRQNMVQLQRVDRYISIWTPAPDLFALLGEPLYFAYQQKHLIDEETELVRVNLPGAQNYRYAFYDVAVITGPPFLPVATTTLEVPFESWIKGTDNLLLLAHAKRLNQVVLNEG